MDLCAALLQGHAAAVLHTRDLDDVLQARVIGDPGAATGAIWPRFLLRADATGPAARIRLADAPSLDVAFLHKPDAPVDWTDAARLLRRDVTGKPNPLYRDSIIYKIFCDSPGATDYTTFDEALPIIRTVHQLAPWLKQVVYVVGWQYEGHDTGYPATDKINARLGGPARPQAPQRRRPPPQRPAQLPRQLRRCLHEQPHVGRARHRPRRHWQPPEGRRLGWRPVLRHRRGQVCCRPRPRAHPPHRRPDARPRQLPHRRPHRGPGPPRLQPPGPESSRDGLAGKIALVHEFNRLGIDVTSEGFTAPFVGVIGHAWHLWHRPDRLFEGEQAIPFIPFIYHGGPTCYGNGAQDNLYAQHSALYGAGFSTDWTKHITPHEIAWAT